MAKYLYNGVVLPVLPEWDMETHPYAIIGYCDAQGYVFSYAAEPWTANEDGQIWPSRFLTYRLSDDTWVSTNGVVSYVTPVWTNTDIFNEDGTIYLTASDPVPVSIPKWVHMNSFLKGLALGLAGKPLDFAPGKEPVPDVPVEPVAYLYNGIRLPKPPEWDYEKFPHMIIREGFTNLAPHAGETYYQIKAGKSAYKSNDDGDVLMEKVDGIHLLANCYIPYTSWSQHGEVLIPDGSTYEDLRWTNKDIPGVMNGTDPVPVYE